MAKKIALIIFLCIGIFALQSTASATEVTTCEGDLHTLRLYNVMFDRNPDPKGGIEWLQRSLTLEETAQSFENSEEFWRKHVLRSDQLYVKWFYREVLERPEDPEGVAKWIKKVSEEGRASVATEWVRSKEVIDKYPYVRSPFCAYAREYGTTEVAPGVTSLKKGKTVIALVDQSIATIDTAHTPDRTTSTFLRKNKNYDLVINANWFDSKSGKVIAPLISDGKSLGGKDDDTKGFLGEKNDGTSFSIFHGAIQEPPADTRTGASGIHIVHQGESKENIFDDSYTFTTKKHSAVGYTDEGYWIFISSYENDAKELAQLMLRFKATEAIMLDGGGSTQIAIKNSAGLYALFWQRPVTSHITVTSNGAGLFAE